MNGQFKWHRVIVVDADRLAEVLNEVEQHWDVFAVLPLPVNGFVIVCRSWVPGEDSASELVTECGPGD